MPSDLRPSLKADGRARSQTPLLFPGRPVSPYTPGSPGFGESNPPMRPKTLSRRSTFHERDPEALRLAAQKKKWTLAGFFLILSLISFAVQTETAVYIQHHLGWKKAYCMLYFTHGSWTLLWPAQLLILRIQKRSLPWKVFLRRHIELLTQTAQMVRYQTLHLTPRQSQISPWGHLAWTTAYVTCALTVAGGSWYVAVDLTTASDLTAIYNCSAFFAYAFSIPLLHERVRFGKVFAVAIAIIGVLIVAYGDQVTPKHGSKSGGGSHLHDPSDSNPEQSSSRTLGNFIIGVGSVLYGFYEVLYKRVACPPEGCSAGRGTMFALTFGSCIGLFTLTVLWIPLPILHWTGREVFEWPTGKAAGLLFISVFANAVFSGSFLILISLTSPVLSSVAALLTIFIVALIDQLLPPPLYSPLSGAAIAGGLLIIFAFGMLSWSTWKEMEQERKARDIEESETEDEESGLDEER